jgi:transcriptional regulator with XRE-family HTH domain
MSEESLTGSSAQAEVHRLMDVIRTLARMMGYSNREMERRANLNHATAAKYFKGEGEPKLELVLTLVDALGLDYAEFFDLAYGGRQPAQPTAAAQRIRGMLEGLQPGAFFGLPLAPPPKEERTPPRPEDLENLKRAVREVMAEINYPAEAAKVRKFRGRG